MTCLLFGHQFTLRSISHDLVTWHCKRCGHVKRRFARV